MDKPKSFDFGGCLASPILNLVASDARKFPSESARMEPKNRTSHRSPIEELAFEKKSNAAAGKKIGPRHQESEEPENLKSY